MTQIRHKILETSKARVLVVGGLPEGAKDYNIVSTTVSTYITWVDYRLQIRPIDCIPIEWDDKFKPLGNIGEITEDQWQEIIPENLTYQSADGHVFYLNFKHEDGKAYFATATESGLSLIESVVCLKNPYGDTAPDMISTPFRWDITLEEGKGLWQAAEEQVFRNPVLFWEKK